MFHVDHADLTDDRSRLAVAQLLEAYLLETEREKAAHGLSVPIAEGKLAAKYQREVDDPGAAFEGSLILTAVSGSGISGVVIVTRANRFSSEIKRLWVNPDARGSGVGSALLSAAISAAVESGAVTLRLTVWQWREAALRAYRRHGFRDVASWDDRELLVCMELDLNSPASLI